MKNRKLKLLAWLLVLAMALSLMPAAALAADEEEPAGAQAAEFVSWDRESRTATLTGTEGQEYVLVPQDGSLDWADAVTASEGKVTFSGLDWAASYTVYTRLAGDEEGLAAATDFVTGLESVTVETGENGFALFSPITAKIEPADAQVLYQWYTVETLTLEDESEYTYLSPIQGASSASFTPFSEEGKTLALMITTDGYKPLEEIRDLGPVYMPLFFSSTDYDEEAGSFTVSFTGAQGQEYAIAKSGETPDWTGAAVGDGESGIEFAGLAPITRYDIWTRIAGTESGGKTSVTTGLPGEIQFLTDEYATDTDPDTGDTYEYRVHKEYHPGDTVTVKAIEGVTFRWTRDEEVASEEGWSRYVQDSIPGAQGESYTFTSDDVDKNITVIALADGIRVASADVYGYVAAPEGAPAVSSWDSESIQVSGQTGSEYTIVPKGGTPDWTGAKTPHEDGIVTFEGLTAGTQYDIYGRTVGGDTAVSVSAATSLEGVGLDYDGLLTVGTVITASPDPETAGLNYQWYRLNPDDPAPTVIEGASGSTYTVSSGDVGYVIMVRVFAGTLLVGDCDTLDAVKLTPDAAPEKPRAFFTSSDGIGVYGVMQGYLPQEYIILEKGAEPTDEDWENADRQWFHEGETVRFRDLTAATEYTVFTRLMGTGSSYPSEPVSADFITGIDGTGLYPVNLLVGATVEAQADPESEDYTFQWCYEVTTEYMTPYGYTSQRTDYIPIEGATGRTYTFTENDLGRNVTFKVMKNGHELAVHTGIGPITDEAQVYFDTDGGTEIEMQVVKAGGKIEKPADPTRPSSRFLGWYYNDEPWDFENGVVDSDYMCLTAKWQWNIIVIYDEPEVPARDTFRDVSADDAFYAAVYHCFDKGWFVGATEDTFSPDGTMSRAMLATVLYRMAGSPHVTGKTVFSDVEEGKWYYDAVLWCAENGIMLGYDTGKFSPRSPVTREQLVTVLYRFGKNRGVDVTTGDDTNILSYDDVFETSPWAMAALQWTIHEGIFAPRSEDVLDPKTPATRAEAAQVLMNYDNLTNKA
ncbi:MAG: S-layer homology domain-containing protein [Oscillospiraceae bacterium]|nr:S-layer homology domain-containing protein [Oscillospiraceae bacterium]